ncbi:TonB-dependent receptor [Aeromonas caviae]|uniref:TonB-dependent receptor n=1 Tax=Aeromonas caviae TaxID=648 RepID=UPI0008525738|nr:TonB-dependent receptor [Aeromonas caviae]OEG01526.1 hypothetical protein BFG06_08795 [Aeromonas caviae]
MDLKASSLTSNTEAEGQLQTGPVAHRLLVGLEQGWQDRTPKLYQNANPIPAGNLYDPGSGYPNGIGWSLATLLCPPLRQSLSPPAHVRIDPGRVCL